MTSPKTCRRENHLENENVHRITREGREIILIGTAHVSRESADLVERVIAEEKPDTVCVELCKPRYEAIRQQDKWQQTDIVKVIREKRTTILLSQLIMASLQRKIAQKFNITPGEEMLRAIARAEEIGAEIVLADREIRVTLLRTWRKMGFWSKVKFLPDVLLSLFATDEITEEEIEKLKQHDVLELALQTVGEKLPGLKTTLIDERDLYLAHTIGHAPGARIVAVVGAGHVPGILKHLGEEIDIEAAEPDPREGDLGEIRRLVLFAGHRGPLRRRVLLFRLPGQPEDDHLVGGHHRLLLGVRGAAPAGPSADDRGLGPRRPDHDAAPPDRRRLGRGSRRGDAPQAPGQRFPGAQDDIVSIRGFFRNKITRLLLLVAVVNLTTSIGTFVAIPVIMRFF